MELKSLQKIKVAKGKASVDAFADVLQTHTADEFVEQYAPKSYRTVKKLFKKYEEETEYSKRKRKETYNIYNNALDDKESFDKAYKKFNQDIMADSKITNDYFRKLQDKGYDALYDYNDRDAADNPIIVFNRVKSLKTTSISELSIRDIDGAYLYLEKMGLY